MPIFTEVICIFTIQQGLSHTRQIGYNVARRSHEVPAYGDFVKSIREQLGASEAAWPRLLTEIPNLRAAIVWCLGVLADPDAPVWTALYANGIDYNCMPWTLKSPLADGRGLLDWR